MALFVDKKRTIVKRVKDPDDGTTYHVTLRKMDEGYRQERSDMLMRARADVQRGRKLPGGKRKRRQEITEYNLGTVRLNDLAYSIVEWDFKDEDGDTVAVSPRYIQMLDTDIADQIWNHIEDLNPTVFNPLEDEDEEDEEENSNGHSTTLTAQPIFGEEEGPKESAEQS